jgi:hypothetical protein
VEEDSATHQVPCVRDRPYRAIFMLSGLWRVVPSGAMRRSGDGPVSRRRCCL